MKDVYSSIKEFNLGKEWKVVIVFHDMIADMISYKKTFNRDHWGQN